MRNKINWKSAIIVLAGLGVLALVTGFLVISNGWYNVGATSPHSPLVEKTLRYTMERSVRNHASEVIIPPVINLQNPVLAEKAIGHYSIACAPCHAAPGEPKASWMVLYPPPPPLTDSEVVENWSDKELFWIIKNGIKNTGMIALPPGHSDNDVWAIAAFVRQLPKMTAEHYKTLVKTYQESEPHSAHGSTSEQNEQHTHAH